MSKFENFSQSDRPICSRLNWLIRQLAKAHKNWSTLAYFSNFSLIRANNSASFFFVRFLTLQGTLCQNLRIFFNQLYWLAIVLVGSSRQLAKAYPNWSTLACFSHFSLIRAYNCAPFLFIFDSLLSKEHSIKI